MTAARDLALLKSACMFPTCFHISLAGLFERFCDGHPLVSKSNATIFVGSPNAGSFQAQGRSHRALYILLRTFTHLCMMLDFYATFPCTEYLKET
jgi:hypothetical protein